MCVDITKAVTKKMKSMKTPYLHLLQPRGQPELSPLPQNSTPIFNCALCCPAKRHFLVSLSLDTAMYKLLAPEM